MGVSSDGFRDRSNAWPALGMCVRMRSLRGRNRITVSGGNGGEVWLQYEYIDQYITWLREGAGFRHVYNNDKYIRTNFMEAGGQYMFNRSLGTDARGALLGAQLQGRLSGQHRGHPLVPEQLDRRHPDPGNVHGSIGGYVDRTLAGFKVPSGDWHYPPYDRDLQIGTGSTDLLFGAYHLGTFRTRLGRVPMTFRELPFDWFAQADYDLPFTGQDHYLPGKELDGAVGAYYDFGKVAFLKGLAPMLTFLVSDRTRDTESNADHFDTGYTRFIVAPGGEIGVGAHSGRCRH